MSEALINTKRIEWNRSLQLYAVHMDYIHTLTEALKKTTFRLFEASPCDTWWLPYKKALNLEIK